MSSPPHEAMPRPSYQLDIVREDKFFKDADPDDLIIV
jgi:hypothetical protein